MTSHVGEISGQRRRRCPAWPVYPLRPAPRWAIEGTGLRGRVVVPLALVRVRLGRPRARPTEKSRHEWIVHTPHGPVAVYDYGVGGWPEDCSGVVVEWHLGAHNHLAAAWIARYLLAGCAHLTDPTAVRCPHCARDADCPGPAGRVDDHSATPPPTSDRRTP